jgi:hypothetical protein
MAGMIRTRGAGCDGEELGNPANQGCGDRSWKRLETDIGLAGPRWLIDD